MKKHVFTRIWGVAVIVCLLVSTMLPAFALNSDDIQPRLTRIDGMGAEIFLTTSDRADCYSFVELVNTTDKVTLTMELQRSSNGSSWTTIKSWSTTGSDFVSLDKSWYIVTSGYSHRVVATATAYNSAGVFMESVTATSAVV